MVTILDVRNIVMKSQQKVAKKNFQTNFSFIPPYNPNFSSLEI